jgi:hypothetical protein
MKYILHDNNYKYIYDPELLGHTQWIKNKVEHMYLTFLTKIK